MGGAWPEGEHRGWLLDELASAGRENLDPAHVARYDAKEDAQADRELAVLQAAGLAEDALLVEFGPGTGQFTTVAAACCARLVAVDVSEPMLARLRQKLERLGLGNVELVRAGFLSYRHAGAGADVIYTRYALHHLPDFWKAVALARMRAILAPGGIIRLWDVVYDFAPSQAEERVAAWCASGGSDPQAGWRRTEIEQHVREEHTTFTWLLEPIIERSGLEILSAEPSRDGLSARYLLRRA